MTEQHKRRSPCCADEARRFLAETTKPPTSLPAASILMPGTQFVAGIRGTSGASIAWPSPDDEAAVEALAKELEPVYGNSARDGARAILAALAASTDRG